MSAHSASSPSAPSAEPNTRAHPAAAPATAFSSSSPLAGHMSTTSVLLSLLALAFALLLLLPATKSRPLLAWLDRKRYQYELTSSLYMLTSTEKFIFNSLLFLLLAITVIAGSLYLPDHVATIASRCYYYINGGDSPKLYT